MRETKRERRFTPHVLGMAKWNNKEIGHVVGGWTGIVLGVYFVVLYNGLPLSMPLVDDAVTINPVVTQLIRFSLPFLLAGWLSNWCSNAGMWIDVMTNSRTVIDLIQKFIFLFRLRKFAQPIEAIEKVKQKIELDPKNLEKYSVETLQEDEVEKQVVVVVPINNSTPTKESENSSVVSSSDTTDSSDTKV